MVPSHRVSGWTGRLPQMTAEAISPPGSLNCKGTPPTSLLQLRGPALLGGRSRPTEARSGMQGHPAGGGRGGGCPAAGCAPAAWGMGAHMPSFLSSVSSTPDLADVGQRQAPRAFDQNARRRIS